MVYLWIVVGVIAWAVMTWTDDEDEGYELIEDD